MKYNSRLLWIGCDDLPELARAGVAFCVNNLAWDTDWCVVQLYDNTYIPELDGAGIYWQYPDVNPGGTLGKGRKYNV
jgi:hypothetical protein